MRSLFVVLLVGCGSDRTPEPPPPSAGEESEQGRDEAPVAMAETPAVMAAQAMAPTPAPAEAQQEEAIAVQADTLRFVVAHESELLGSERRGLAEIKRRLERGVTLNEDEPSDDEKQAIAQLMGGVQTLPRAWASFETVVALQLPTPSETRQGRRLSNGMRGIFVLRPPATEPVLSVVLDDNVGWSIGDAELARWISEIVEAS